MPTYNYRYVDAAEATTGSVVSGRHGSLRAMPVFSKCDQVPWARSALKG